MNQPACSHTRKAEQYYHQGLIKCFFQASEAAHRMMAYTLSVDFVGLDKLVLTRNVPRSMPFWSAGISLGVIANVNFLPSSSTFI